MIINYSGIREYIFVGTRITKPFKAHILYMSLECTNIYG